MTLQDFLARSDTRPATFADRLGVPASTVTRWLNGERKPSLCLLVRIREATGGAVTADDFLPRDPSSHGGAA